MMKLNESIYNPIKWNIILVALVGFLLFPGCKKGSEKQTGSPSTPQVATIKVKPQDTVLTTELPGRTSAYREAQIRPQVNGRLKKRLFKEGSDVKAGQRLYQVDPVPFEAALENARAALARSKAKLPAISRKAERFKKLLADRAVSQQDYDDAVSALSQTKADIEFWKAKLKTAKINLGYTRITAPISGRIGKSFITEGAVVTAYQAQELATIQHLDPIYVDVTQSTTEMLSLKRRLKKGQLKEKGAEQNKVKIILEDGSTYPLEGTFKFRDVTVDPTTGSVVLRIVVPNPEHVLLPGMFVRAKLKEGVKEDAILIPQQAVSRNRKGDPFVMLVNPEGKVEMQILKLDRAIANKWLVSSGLEPGDQVIVEGLQYVRPGATVKAVPLVSDQKSKT